MAATTMVPAVPTATAVGPDSSVSAPLIEAIGVAAPVAMAAYSVREFAAESTVQVSPNVGAGAALATLDGPRSGDKQAAGSLKR